MQIKSIATIEFMVTIFKGCFLMADDIRHMTFSIQSATIRHNIVLADSITLRIFQRQL